MYRISKSIGKPFFQLVLGTRFIQKLNTIMTLVQKKEKKKN